MDPEIDFAALMDSFDTMLLGRGTYEAARQMGGGPAMPGMQVYVLSTTLRQDDCPGVTVSDNAGETVAKLKAAPGKDIWLFGGGSLFRSLLGMGLVDTVEVAIIPVLLGGGIPLLPDPAERAKLKLTNHRVYAKTGTVALDFFKSQLYSYHTEIHHCECAKLPPLADCLMSTTLMLGLSASQRLTSASKSRAFWPESFARSKPAPGFIGSFFQNIFTRIKFTPPHKTCIPVVRQSQYRGRRD